ncbi:MAG TPA: hypothetical protein PLZ54_01455 [Paludibacteraceae bacterium]|nr:hypothetical protein [Paludibacteraceae bacterium]HOL29469.1 hypothetical protein [Paludibacteraceae bacterium]HPD58860.1 hypothetical protein [Paludibacteraceae bacterium]
MMKAFSHRTKVRNLGNITTKLETKRYSVGYLEKGEIGEKTKNKMSFSSGDGVIKWFSLPSG